MKVMGVVLAKDVRADDLLLVLPLNSPGPWSETAPVSVTTAFATGHGRVQLTTAEGVCWFDEDVLVCVFREAQ